MNLNKVIIAGNVTQDPQIRSLPSGQPVANFGVATNRYYYDQNNQRQQQTEFHNVVVFGKQAEVVRQYVNQGSLILIEGRLQTRNYQDKNGITRYRTEIITERLQLGPRGYKNNANQSQNNPNPSNTKQQNDIPVVEENSYSSPGKDKKGSSKSKPKQGGSNDEINVEDLPL